MREIPVSPVPPRPRGAHRPELVRRLEAVERTRARFEGKALELGRADCLLLARAHLVFMGHRGLPKPPRYRGVKGALRALRAQGADSLAALMDKYLEPIAPAAMLLGDVALVAGTEAEGGETLMVSLGGKLLGWHEDAPALTVVDPHPGAIERAWRA